MTKERKINREQNHEVRNERTATRRERGNGKESKSENSIAKKEEVEKV